MADPTETTDPTTNEPAPEDGALAEIPDAVVLSLAEVPPSTEMQVINPYVQFGANFAAFDPETPPESWGQFFDILLGRIRFSEQSLPWLIGDAINFAEKHYDESVYSQFLDETQYSLGTLRNMAWVARRWPPAERDTSIRWSDYRTTAGLRYDAPALAAAIVSNAAERGHTRREVMDQTNAAAQRVRADKKDAPGDQLDAPKIATQIHRPGCPTCTCTGASVIGKPGRGGGRGKASAAPVNIGSRRGRKTVEGTAEAVATAGKAPRKGKTADAPAATTNGRTAAPKPTGGRKRRGRAEANPLAVQVDGVADVADDAPPLDGSTFDTGDGEITVAIEHAEADDREPVETF